MENELFSVLLKNGKTTLFTVRPLESIKAIKPSKTHPLSPRGYIKKLIDQINQNGSSLKVSRSMKNVLINELSIQLKPFASSLYSGLNRFGIPDIEGTAGKIRF